MEWVYQHFDSVDTRSLRTGYFLNRGFLFDHWINAQRQIQADDRSNNVVFSSPLHFESYAMGLRNAAVKSSSIPDEATIQEVLASYEQKPQENTVPVGILFQPSEFLKDYEIEESIEAKKRGQHIRKEYEQVNIYSASVLKQKVYSGEVTFEFPSSLYYIGDRQVRDVYIDVSDGKGYRKVKAGSSFTVQYENDGEKGIAIKFRTHQGEVISHSVLDVVTLGLEEPDMVFGLNGPVNGRTLTGGQAQVYMGCDGVFDRPVIIIEGIDQLNNRGIADIREDYTDNRFRFVEDFLRSNGLDVVYLNFSDGGADIRTNARVLERLIDDVNAQKVGNQRLVVIGESMGGIVARYCLTDMERRGRTHQVGEYISYDSPHLGANTPVSVQQILLDFEDIDVRQLFNFGQSVINRELRRLNAPASRQLLLRFKGPNPHPDYVALQNELNTLGFPRQGGIRNIAIVHGNENGGRQNPGVNFNPGDQTLAVTGSVYALVSGSIRTWTNQINGRNRVSSIWIFLSGIPTTIRDRSFTFDAFNYDIAPGGWEDDQGFGDLSGGWLNFVNVLEWFGDTGVNFGRGQFGFLPLFSSVAYTGPRNNQADIERSVANMQANNWIPFDAVYAADENTPHVNVGFMQGEWDDLLRTELGVITDFACQVPAGNAAPLFTSFTGDRYEFCPYQKGTFRASDNTVIDGLYTYQWRLTGNGVNWVRSGLTYLFNAGSMSPGTYTLTLTQRYNGATAGRSRSQVIRVLPSFATQCSSGNLPPGTPIARAAVTPTRLHLDTATVEVGNIRLWPNPANDKLTVAYQMVKGGSVSITLTSALGTQQKEDILTTSYRPEGNYQETCYTDHLAPGLYIVKVQTDSQLLQNKVFIKK